MQSKLGFLKKNLAMDVEEFRLPTGLLPRPISRKANRRPRQRHLRQPPSTPLPTPAPPTPPAAEPAAVPTTSPGIGSAQVLISPPAPTFRVGGGPYTVPLLDHRRVAAVDGHADADLRSDQAARAQRCRRAASCAPAACRVVFTQQVNGNRVDITLSRGADATGASGTGVLAAILFDAIAPGR